MEGSGVGHLFRHARQTTSQEASQQKQLAAAPTKKAAKKAGGAAAMVRERVRTLAEMEEAVLQVVADLVGDGVDVGEPLAGQGLDSLAAMELRQKLQVGFRLSLCPA